MTHHDATSQRTRLAPADASWPKRLLRLLIATVRDAVRDDLAGEAAKMGFYFFLSLFPFILVVFAITGIVGGDEAFASITRLLERSVPDYAWQFVRRLIAEITGNPRPGILSIGILLIFWAASNGIAALSGGLNRIYDVQEARPWWQRRLIALFVLVVGVILVVLAAAAFVPGLESVQASGLSGAWRLIRWPFAITLVTGTVWLAYYYLPARDQRHSRGEALVGAIVATLLWIVATTLFRFYVSNFGRYGSAYGAVGAVIVLMIWFYISAFAVLAGGELGAQLERAHGERRSA